jgi:GT2 family glycosyltransferase
MDRKLSIIIVSWNVCKDVFECITSILQNAPSFSYEIILVDNHSTDGTVANIKEHFPEVAVIENEENLGFAAANNKGIEKATGEHIFFLNPDTVVLPGAIDRLVHFLDSNLHIGICGPRMLNADRTLQKSARGFPTCRGAMHRYTFLRYLGVFRRDFRQWMNRDFDYSQSQTVDQLMGAALVVRKSLLDKVGRFDERFFLYYEDVDLCYRVKEAGWQVLYCPDAEIIHTGGRSSEQAPAKIQYIRLCSLLKYFRKHRNTLSSCSVTIFLKIGLLIKSIISLVGTSVLMFIGTITGNVVKKKKCEMRIISVFKFIVLYYPRFVVA